MDVFICHLYFRMAWLEHMPSIGAHVKVDNLLFPFSKKNDWCCLLPVIHHKRVIKYGIGPGQNNIRIYIDILVIQQVTLIGILWYCYNVRQPYQHHYWLPLYELYEFASGNNYAIYNTKTVPKGKCYVGITIICS